MDTSRIVKKRKMSDQDKEEGASASQQPQVPAKKPRKTSNQGGKPRMPKTPSPKGGLSNSQASFDDADKENVAPPGKGNNGFQK